MKLEKLSEGLMIVSSTVTKRMFRNQWKTIQMSINQDKDVKKGLIRRN